MPDPMSHSHDATRWQPPAEGLVWRESLWVARQQAAVSYPEQGNEFCFAIEDDSYWFRHRASCILAVLARFSPAGLFLDVGGGNGQVATSLQRAGHQVALLEPGSGAHNALRRGLTHVIQATFSDAGFRPGSLAAAGAFDVIEHIKDDAAFLREIRHALQPGGRFYCTVPAANWLWSADDTAAGHYRRYTTSTLTRQLETAGFEVEYVTPFFTWLVVPVFTLRTLPSRLGRRQAARAASADTIRSDHRMPSVLQRAIAPIHAWELQRIIGGRSLPFGTSLLCVARARH